MIFLRFSDTIDNRMKDARRTEEKVFSYIEKHHMLQPGDRVVAGVSGGADSLCLLFVLLEWAKKAPLSLAVVHVDHGLRQESGEDALYVKELCRRLKLPFYLTRENVKQRAEMEKCSQEEAGRKIRYKAFRRAAEGFVAFGAKFPGEEEKAHQKNESASIENLMKAAEIYAEAIYRLCA